MKPKQSDQEGRSFSEIRYRARGSVKKREEERMKEIPDSSVHILVNGGHGERAEALMSL